MGTEPSDGQPCGCMCVCTRMCVRVCCVCERACMHACVCVCVYVCMYVCLCVCARTAERRVLGSRASPGQMLPAQIPGGLPPFSWSCTRGFPHHTTENSH